MGSLEDLQEREKFYILCIYKMMCNERLIYKKEYIFKCITSMMKRGNENATYKEEEIFRYNITKMKRRNEEVSNLVD